MIARSSVLLPAPLGPTMPTRPRQGRRIPRPRSPVCDGRRRSGRTPRAECSSRGSRGFPRQFSLAASFRCVAAEGACDEGDVVVEHADVGPFVRSRLAHGVGEQFAADHDFAAARALPRPALRCSCAARCSRQKRPRTFVYQQVDQLVDPLQTRFRLRRDALHALHLESVSATEIVERVVRRDQHATRRGIVASDLRP